jgi:hypothetical protein
LKEEFEDTKGVIRNVNRRTNNIMANEKEKGDTATYFTIEGWTEKITEPMIHIG